jgi:hypothetical protein
LSIPSGGPTVAANVGGDWLLAIWTDAVSCEARGAKLKAKPSMGGNKMAQGAILGVLLGGIIGAVTNNLGFWMVIGVPIGVACGLAVEVRSSRIHSD